MQRPFAVQLFYVKKKGIIFFLLLWLFSPAAQGQVRHLGMADGLSGNHINTVLKDSYGFIWLGTKEGLNRFDGHEFKIYQHSKFDSLSLENNDVWQLLQDDRKVLWIITAEGLSQFDYHTGRFLVPENYRNDSYRKLALLKGNVYAVKNKQLVILDNFAREIPLFRQWEVEDLFQVENGLLVKCTAGLFFYDGTNLQQLTGDHFLVIHAAARLRDQWLISTEKGLALYTFRKEKTFREVAVPLDAVASTICIDKKENAWIGTPNGTRVLQYPDLQEVTPSALADLRSGTGEIKALYQDNTGLIWLGTAHSGVYFYDPAAAVFTRIGKQDGLKSNLVLSLLQNSDGELLVGTSEGVNIVTLANGTGSIKGTRSFPNPVLAATAVVAMEEDDRHYFFCTAADGFFVYRKSTGSVRHFKDGQLPSNACHSLKKLKNGKIAVATSKGIFLYDPQLEIVQQLVVNINHPYVQRLEEDNRGNLWACTSNGLDKINLVTGKISHYQSSMAKDSLSHNNVTGIVQDREGNYWISTGGGGFCLFEPLLEKFTMYDSRKGLVNDVVYGLLADDAGNIWLSTGKGLSRFDKKSKAFVNYTIRSGLPFDEFTTNAYYRNEAGMLFFGGTGGVIAFNPAKVLPPKESATISISDIRINYAPVWSTDLGKVTGSIQQPEKIDLFRGHRFISFLFSAMDPRRGNDVSYAYKLEGYDKDWIYTAHQRTATYTSLPAGNYQLRIRTVDGNGIFNNAELVIPVSVHLPFWASWKFIAGMGILAMCALCYGIWTWSAAVFSEKLKKVQHSNALHEERYGLMLQFHAFVKQQTAKLRSPVAPEVQAEHCLAQMQQSVFETEKFVLPQAVTAAVIEAELKKLIVQIEARNTSGCGILLKMEGDSSTVLSPQRALEIFKVCSGAIENASCSFNATLIEVLVEIKRDNFYLSVKDNGDGHEQDHEQLQEHYFSGIYEKVKQLRGEISLRSSLEEGTFLSVFMQL